MPELPVKNIDCTRVGDVVFIDVGHGIVLALSASDTVKWGLAMVQIGTGERDVTPEDIIGPRKIEHEDND